MFIPMDEKLESYRRVDPETFVLLPKHGSVQVSGPPLQKSQASIHKLSKLQQLHANRPEVPETSTTLNPTRLNLSPLPRFRALTSPRQKSMWGRARREPSSRAAEGAFDFGLFEISHRARSVSSLARLYGQLGGGVEHVASAYDHAIGLSLR